MRRRDFFRGIAAAFVAAMAPVSARRLAVDPWAYTVTAGGPLTVTAPRECGVTIRLDNGSTIRIGAGRSWTGGA